MHSHPRNHAGTSLSRIWRSIEWATVVQAAYVSAEEDDEDQRLPGEGKAKGIRMVPCQDARSQTPATRVHGTETVLCTVPGSRPRGGQCLEHKDLGDGSVRGALSPHIVDEDAAGIVVHDPTVGMGTDTKPNT